MWGFGVSGRKPKNVLSLGHLVCVSVEWHELISNNAIGKRGLVQTYTKVMDGAYKTRDLFYSAIRHECRYEHIKICELQWSEDRTRRPGLLSSATTGAKIFNNKNKSILKLTSPFRLCCPRNPILLRHRSFAQQKGADKWPNSFPVT